MPCPTVLQCISWKWLSKRLDWLFRSSNTYVCELFANSGLRGAYAESGLCRCQAACIWRQEHVCYSNVCVLAFRFVIIIVITLYGRFADKPVRWQDDLVMRQFTDETTRSQQRRQVHSPAVAALHQGVPAQMTWLEDPPPFLPPWLRPGSALPIAVLCVGNSVNRK